MAPYFFVGFIASTKTAYCHPGYQPFIIALTSVVQALAYPSLSCQPMGFASRQFLSSFTFQESSGVSYACDSRLMVRGEAKVVNFVSLPRAADCPKTATHRVGQSSHWCSRLVSLPSVLVHNPVAHCDALASAVRRPFVARRRLWPVVSSLSPLRRNR